MILLTDRISCIPASSSPLSADIGIIRGDNAVYLYDVGNGEESFAKLSAVLKNATNIQAVLSHFHPDHTGNLERLSCQRIYLGDYTEKHLYKEKSGIEEPEPVAEQKVVTEKVTVLDGICLELFPVPSSHAKGSLGLTVDYTYTFLGDATCCTMKKGKQVYNVQFLKEELELLKSLETKYFLLSHKDGLLQPKDTVVEELELIYARRRKNEPYIEVENRE